MEDKEINVFMAKIAEQAERYDEMAEYMKKVVLTGAELTTEERNLLSVAYKNRIGARRAAWRVISSIEAKKENNELHKQYREDIEKELKDICQEIIGLLSNSLIADKKHSTTLTEAQVESIVFFLKMKGDYWRYEAEIADDDSKKVACQKAEEAYRDADKLALEHKLKPTNPILLGLYLNYSVFYYELCDDRTRACELAKHAFDKAIADLDALNEDCYKDSTLIMQLLRDNLTLWTSSEDDAHLEEVDDAN